MKGVVESNNDLWIKCITDLGTIDGDGSDMFVDFEYDGCHVLLLVN